MNSPTPPPKRLAPQRKRPASQTVVVVSPPPPLDLSLPDDNSLHNDEADPPPLATVADWTLRENPTPIPDAPDDEYHGEIDNDSDSDVNQDNEASSMEQSANSRIEEIPRGFALDLSSSPPPSSHPLLLVDLRALCGYHPEDPTEKTLLLSQLHDALLQDDGAGFDERAAELFDSGVAIHVDSETYRAEEDDGTSPLAVVTYPDVMVTSAGRVDTRHLWRMLHASHPLSVVQKLLGLLRNTSRSMLWKVEMHRQLRELVVEEYRAMVRRREREEYEGWRGGRRERLEKLYEVRETFLLRVDLARDRYAKIVQDRERRVAVEMRRRRGDLWQQTKQVENEVSDEESIVFDQNGELDEDGWGGVIAEDNIIGTDHGIAMNRMYGQDSHVVHDYDDDDESNEEWSPVGMSVVVNATCEEKASNHDGIERELKNNLKSTKESINKLQPITMDDNAQRKAKRIERTKNIVTSLNDVAKEEEIVREKLKTNDERIAEAMLRSLQERLDGVDNLLENLQEEEWAEEENEEDQDHSTEKEEEEFPDVSEMTLLDQILAMILGALSMTFSGAKCQAEHYRFIKEEHKSIVDEWKETFGRLPPSNHVEDETASVAELDTMGHAEALSKETLSALCNESKDWDEVDWDAVLP